MLGLSSNWKGLCFISNHLPSDAESIGPRTAFWTARIHSTLANILPWAATLTSLIAAENTQPFYSTFISFTLISHTCFWIWTISKIAYAEFWKISENWKARRKGLGPCKQEKHAIPTGETSFASVWPCYLHTVDIRPLCNW